MTKTYTLDGVNDGYDDMRAGKNIRGVMVYDVDARGVMRGVGDASRRV